MYTTLISFSAAKLPGNPGNPPWLVRFSITHCMCEIQVRLAAIRSASPRSCALRCHMSALQMRNLAAVIFQNIFIHCATFYAPQRITCASAETVRIALCREVFWRHISTNQIHFTKVKLPKIMKTKMSDGVQPLLISLAQPKSHGPCIFHMCAKSFFRDEEYR